MIPEKGRVVFLTSLAGGTGAGALPVIFPLAAEKKSQTFAVVSMPLKHEGSQRSQTATRNLKQLDPIKNNLLVIEQKHLEPFLPTKAFVDIKAAYQLLNQVVIWKTLSFLSG